MEWRLFDSENPPEIAFPSWFQKRKNVPHLDSPSHRRRLETTSTIVLAATLQFDIKTVVDLGCGDGGLLSLLSSIVSPDLKMWGYDVREDSVRNARSGADVRYADFLEFDLDFGERPTLVVATEMLEHLLDPHSFIISLRKQADVLVASVPWSDRPEHHYRHHVWAWDEEGFKNFLEEAGFKTVKMVRSGKAQIWMAI